MSADTSASFFGCKQCSTICYGLIDKDERIPCLVCKTCSPKSTFISFIEKSLRQGNLCSDAYNPSNPHTHKLPWYNCIKFTCGCSICTACWPYYLLQNFNNKDLFFKRFTSHNEGVLFMCCTTTGIHLPSN
jgi:hypothetical protein